MVLFKNLLLAILCSMNFTNGWIFEKTTTNCGVIYAGSNFTGSNFSLRSPQILNDMWDLVILDRPRPNPFGRSREPSQNRYSRFESFSLVPGCTLKVCDEPYLNGNCGWLNNTQANLDPMWSNQVTTLRCSCPIIMKCKYCWSCYNIKLSPKECARAFLEPNCLESGQYISMKKNSEQPMFGAYEDKIKSLVVSKGCDLTYYSGSDYEENKHVLSYGFYNEFNATIGSYHCDCDKISVKIPPPIETNPERKILTFMAILLTFHLGTMTVFYVFALKDPKLLNIPSTVEEIQSLAKIFPEGHAGLEAALKSDRNKRSPKNAYILLIGLYGSGKSTMINFLLDNSTICDVGSSFSTTSSINEYRFLVQVDELGCNNCELRVIDTPGFGDTRGMKTDETFFTGLETFLNNHEELRHRLPNIILVVSRLNDNRFKGKTSSFVKTLLGMDLLSDKLFDSKYSNVINVLTRFMGENEKVRRNPAQKLRKFREMIREYTLFPEPIVTVVAENKPEEVDMVMVNGNYLLPNGEYYPQNLFEKIQDSTERGQDPIGEAIIRTAFKYPENLNMTRIVFPLKRIPPSHGPYYPIENFNVELTEVSNITANVYNKSP